MPLGFNNPFPTGLAGECRKAGKILSSFLDPRQSFGPDIVIPPSVLTNAKGLAIITVVKAGCLGSGRFGSGIVVARLTRSAWSGPSAITLCGAGIGGQIGIQVTDFVFILNDAAAVRAFSRKGSLTLGGNVSIAAGPVGRTVEAAGAASSRGVAAVFSYSKSKGVFAGVSMEGSALVERRDANEAFYHTRVTAAQIMQGIIPAPDAAEPLMCVLASRAFLGFANKDVHNDAPVHGDQDETRQRGWVWSDAEQGDRIGIQNPRDDDYVYHDRVPNEPNETRLAVGRSFGAVDRRRAGPGRPTAAKPVFATPGNIARDQAIALFTFDAAQDGDLGFKKGDVITILARTEKAEDWWTGRIDDRKGIFPSNYVKALDAHS